VQRVGPVRGAWRCEGGICARDKSGALALSHHPDKSEAADAAQSFARVAASYEVLSDPEKRRQHDSGGAQAYPRTVEEWQLRYYGGKPHGTELYEDDPLVTILTADLFASRVQVSRTPWLVVFYAPWCSHCVNAVPEVKLAAELLAEDDIEVGTVNCDREKQLCVSHGVKAYPQLKLMVPQRPSDAEPDSVAPTTTWATQVGADMNAESMLGAETWRGAARRERRRWWRRGLCAKRRCPAHPKTATQAVSTVSLPASRAAGR
jgi:thiol-disulfide isomerase/thioredoxin